MAPRIGMLNIGHPDYPNDVGGGFADRAAQELQARGIVIVTDGQAYTDPIAALQRGQEMVGERLDGVIIWLGTWIECATALAAIRELEHLPLALWGFGMYDTPAGRQSTGSFVAASVLKGTLERMAYRFKLILGLPDDAPALAAAEAFSRAAHAYARLKRTRLGLVGYAAMSMIPGTCDHALLRRLIGPELVQLDTYTLVRMAEAVTHTEAKELAEEIGSCAEIAVAPERLIKAARLGVALQRLVDRHRLHAINVKCQYELSQEWGMTPCVPLSWLADQGIVTACEGDVMVTATSCLLAYLCTEAVTYADILDVQGDEVLFSACGFAPFSLAHAPAGVRVCELGYPGFDGIISSCTLRRGTVTYARLAEGRGDYRLIYGTGTGVDTELRQGRFPALQVKLDGDPARLIELMPSQHWALCYGDVTASIRDLCHILGIEALRV